MTADVPPEDLALLEEWVVAQWPERFHHEVFWETHRRGRSVTVCETRAPWDGEGEWTHVSLAQLRFVPDAGDWALYWADRNSRWHPYDPDGFHVVGGMRRLINEIDQDKTAIFKG